MSDNTTEYLETLSKFLNILDAEKREQTFIKFAEKTEKDVDQIKDDFGELLHNHVKSVVQSILHQKSAPIAKSLKKTTLANWLYNFIPDKRECQNLIKVYSIEERPIEVHNIQGLLNMSGKTKTKYFVQGLFQTGMYLIVGQPKTGKSLTAYDLSRCLLTGEPFLGRKTTKCNVLIIQNEEALSLAGKKIVTNGLQELERHEPERYKELINSHQLVVAKGLDIGVDLDKICQLIDRYDITCLIVDSLRASIAKSGLTEMDIGSGALLYQLQNAVQERDIVCFVVHHANKSDDNKKKHTAINGISGSNSIAGANDGIVKMMTNSDTTYEGRTTIDVHFYPRNESPTTMNVVYVEGEACSWGFKVLDDNSLSKKMTESIVTILEALGEEHQRWVDRKDEDLPIDGLTLLELESITGMQKYDIISVLNYMERSENIERYVSDGQWCYHIPEDGCDLWYLVEQKEEENRKQQLQEELDNAIIVKLYECQTVDEVKQLQGELTKEDRDRIVKKFPDDLKKHIRILKNPPVFEKGAIVERIQSEEEIATIGKEGHKEVIDVIYDETDPEDFWLYKLEDIDEPLRNWELSRVVAA